MPEYGDIRYVDGGEKICPGDEVRVRCTQKQIYRRAWYLLWLAGGWFNDGSLACDACPSGIQPEDKLVSLCCFADSYAVLPGQLTGPGVAGWFVETFAPRFLVERLGSTPTSWLLVQLNRCYEINAATLRFLIDNLAEGESRLRAEGRNNEADQNKKSIECLKRHGREFGWYRPT